MGKDYFQQACYDGLHGNKELDGETMRKVRNYWRRINFWRRGDGRRNSWYFHYINKHNTEL